MAFEGHYGHLSTIDAAQAMLKDISDAITDEQLARLQPDFILNHFHYDNIRLAGQIELLQLAVIKNGGILAHNKLPIFAKNKNLVNDRK